MLTNERVHCHYRKQLLASGDMRAMVEALVSLLDSRRSKTTRLLGLEVLQCPMMLFCLNGPADTICLTLQRILRPSLFP